MTSPLLADISSWNTFDAPTYTAWARQWDGIARILMRSSQGTIRDAKFEQFWSDAVASGIDCIGIYHFGYPALHPNAAQEASYFASVVGNRLRANDFIWLDLEQNESAAWAHAFYDALPAALLQNKPVLYDSVSHFQQFFAADLSLAAKFDCALAAYPPQWQNPPAAPPGWRCRWWQFTDNDTAQPRIIQPVAGIAMPVDVNMWLGEPARGEHTGMLLQHPLIIGQQDVVYVGKDGHVHLTGNHNDGMAGLVKDSADTNIDLGAPPEQLIKVEGAYSNNGQSINLLATAASGQVYGTAVDTSSNVLEMPWTALAGVVALVPAGSSAEPLAQKIVAALQGAGKTLESGLV